MALPKEGELAFCVSMVDADVDLALHLQEHFPNLVEQVQEPTMEIEEAVRLSGVTFHLANAVLRPCCLKCGCLREWNSQIVSAMKNDCRRRFHRRHTTGHDR